MESPSVLVLTSVAAAAAAPAVPEIAFAFAFAFALAAATAAAVLVILGVLRLCGVASPLRAFVGTLAPSPPPPFVIPLIPAASRYPPPTCTRRLELDLELDLELNLDDLLAKGILPLLLLDLPPLAAPPTCTPLALVPVCPCC